MDVKLRTADQQTYPAFLTVGRNEVAKPCRNSANAVFPGHRVRKNGRNVATEVPAASAFARSGLQMCEKCGLSLLLQAAQLMALAKNLFPRAALPLNPVSFPANRQRRVPVLPKFVAAKLPGGDS